MAKSNYLKKNKDSIFNLLMLGVLFLIATLLIPVLGANAAAGTLWFDIVDFFTKAQDHFTGSWMFYAIILTILFALMGKK